VKEEEAQRMMIIDKHEECYQRNLKIVEEKFEETKEQRMKREALKEKTLQMLRDKKARREYDEMVDPYHHRKSKGFLDDIKAFSDRSTPEDDKMQFRFMMMYGFGFITLMFLGFLSGYMLGFYILRLSEQASLILSIVMGTGTLLLESVLMIYRMYKMEMDKERQHAKEEKHRTVMKLDILKNIENFSVAKGSIKMSHEAKETSMLRGMKEIEEEKAKAESSKVFEESEKTEFNKKND